MNNSSEIEQYQNLVGELKILRQKVEQMLVLMPDLPNMDSIVEVIKKGEERNALILLAKIFLLYDPYVNRIDLHAPITAAADAEVFDWYNNSYVPMYEKMAGLLRKFILDALQPLDYPLALCVGEIIKTAFDHAPFKKNKLLAIEVSLNLETIPSDILQRVNEIYQSFASHSWVAVIALSRCLLEYVLVARQKFFNITVYSDKFNKKRKKYEKRSISHWIEDVEKNRPDLDLGENMTRINDAGNVIMHPEHEKSDCYPPEKSTAKKCIEDITKIISIAYSK